MKPAEKSTAAWWSKIKDWALMLRPLPPLKELESDGGTRSIVEAAHDSFIAMDEFGRILDWNLQAEKTFGWSKSEVRGQMLGDIIVPERFREAHRKGLAHYLRTGEGPVLNKRIQVFAIHRQGHEIPIELTIYPIQQKSGRIFGSFIHDITARVHAEKIQNLQLRTANIFLESNSEQQAFPELLKCVSENFGFLWAEAWIQDTDDTLLLSAHWSANRPEEIDFANRSMGIVFHKGEGIPGRVWQSQQPLILQDLSAETNFPRRAEALRAGFRAAIGVPTRIAEGKALGALVFYSSEKISLDEATITLLTDISSRMGLFIHRRQTEDNLNRLRAELEQKVEMRTRDLAAAYEQAKVANRLKDEFLGTLSHELRTPIGVIQGYIDMLLEGGLTEEEVQSSLLTIHRNTRIQTQIITDLLDVSSIITGKLKLELETLRLETILTAAIETIKATAAAKKIQISTEIDPSVGFVKGDARRLQQVFWNLLGNAVKFTPNEGRVRLTMKSVDGNAVVEITDTGKGVDPLFLPHIFERFRQEDASTTRRFGGLGLGLAIVSHIVEAHGGNVMASSEGIGKGTTFTVTIPLNDVSGEIASSPLTVHSSTALDKLERVQALKDEEFLVVDDELDTRKMLGLILERAGAHVYTACDFNEAVEIYESFHPRFLVSDITMPDHDGYELVTCLRRLAAAAEKQLNAVALTAQAAVQDREKVLAAGFEKHLVKPIHPEELVRELSALVRSTKGGNSSQNSTRL